MPEIEHAIASAMRYAGDDVVVAQVTLVGTAPQALVREIEALLSRRYARAVTVLHDDEVGPIRVRAVEFRREKP